MAKVPRFVLSIQDTKTEVDGPMGVQYYNITIGFKSKRQLLTAVSKLDGRNELQNVIDTFFDTVERFDGVKKERRRAKSE